MYLHNLTTHNFTLNPQKTAVYSQPSSSENFDKIFKHCFCDRRLDTFLKLCETAMC